MELYGHYSRITAIPGERNKLVEILLDAAELLQSNEDCHHYVIGVSGPDTIRVSELWTDKTSHDASLQPENIRSLIMSARPLIHDMGDAVETTVFGGKGVP